MIEILHELSSRFSGFDLQYRNTGWHTNAKLWRARLRTNKNERSDYRITSYGDSMEAAVARLYGELCRRDGNWRVKP